MSYDAEVAHYQRHGYVIFNKHLSADECQQLNAAALRSLFTLAFHEEPDPPEPNYENLELFADPKLREQRLANPRCIWRDGNTRQPLCSKSGGGMVDVHYLPEAQELLTMTHETFDKVAACYGHQRITQRYGPERFSIKFPGSDDMPRHVDTNFIFSENNVSAERVQTLIATNIDTEIDPAQSGTIALIPGFHHYYRHAAIFFHPQTGGYPIKVDNKRFMVLQSTGFDEGLAAFNTLLSELYEIKAGKIEADNWHRPYLDLPLVDDPYLPLAWTPIAMKPGDLICWTHWLPHQNLRCRSSQPRIAFYVTYFEYDDDYIDSEQHRILVKTLKQGDYLRQTKEGDKVIDGRLERQLLHPENEGPYYYWPKDSEEQSFAAKIQGLRL